MIPIPSGVRVWLATGQTDKGRKYQEAIDWCGGSYDPNDIGLLNIRLRIGAIVKRRRAGKAAYERSKR